MSSARRSGCAGSAGMVEGCARSRRCTWQRWGAAVAGAALGGLLGSTCACGGAGPAPQLLVEARAIEVGRRDAEMHRRRQHYTLSAALAIPLERAEPARVAEATNQLGAHELTTTEIATVPLERAESFAGAANSLDARDLITTELAPVPLEQAEPLAGTAKSLDAGELTTTELATVPLERLEPAPLAGTPNSLDAGELTSAELARAGLDELALATPASAGAEPPLSAIERGYAAASGGSTYTAETSPRQRIQPDASESFEDLPRTTQLDLQTVQRLQARYAREPTAAQVAQAAVQAIAGDPERFASMIRRARWRGIVPDLAIGARRVQGVDLRSMLVLDDTARFTSGDDLVLSATLRFELGRLLFAPEEIAIAREARVARAAGLELVRDIVHWYAVRRRLLLERDLLGHTSLARESRIAELEALLDIFTNGAFSRMITGQAAWKTTGASTPASKPP